MIRVSFRARIAMAVFLLAGTMAVVLLLRVQAAEEAAAEAQEAAAESAIGDVLSETARLAVIRSEYSDLEHLFGRIRQNPHVRRIAVADAGGRVVASSDAALLGKALPPLRSGEATAWKTRDLADAAGKQGLLAMEFSNAELLETRGRARAWGAAFALASVTLIALVSVVMATALTRRLALLEEASARIGGGDYGFRTRLRGADEVSALGRTLDDMAARIQTSVGELRTSREQYRLLLDTIPHGIQENDPSGIITFSNPAHHRILGYSEGELVGKAIWDVQGTPEEGEALRRTLAALVAERPRPTPYLTRCRRRDGQLVDLQIDWDYRTDGSGRLAGFISVVTDVSERKRAEARAAHLTRLYAVVSNVNQAIVRIRNRQALMDRICQIAVDEGGFRMGWIGLVDEEGGKVRVVARRGYVGEYVDRLEISLSEGPEARGPTAAAIRSGKRNVCNDIARDERMAPWRERALAHGYRSSAAFPLTVLGRAIGAFNVYSSEAGFFDQEELGLLDELAIDIAFALESIEREEVQLKLVSIVESSSELVGLADEDGRVFYLNRAGRRLLGIGAEEGLRGITLASLLAEPDPLEVWSSLLVAVPPSQAQRAREVSLRHRTSGEPIAVEMAAFTIPQRGTGGPAALAVICRDIRERRRAEEALRHSEEQYRLVVENAGEAIFIAQDGRLKFPNAALAALLGRGIDEIGARPFAEFIHPEDREMVVDRHRRRVAGEDLPTVYEFRVVDASGATRWVQLSAVRIDWEGRPATLNFLGDITEKKSLEQQLLHAQRMEAIGRLAGGVAHDFNNILAAIIGYGGVALVELPAGSPVRGDVEQMLVAANRAADLTRSLLAFSRRQVNQPQPLTLDAVIGRVHGLLRRVIGEDIALRTALGAPETVFADPGQIEQLLLNLATNARDAMPRGGQLTVETRRSRIDEEFIRKHGFGKRGEYVLVSVSDTGEGMDGATRQRIFEPFFTTKEVGKGTGLGLAMVYGIVKQHDGFIAVDSERGKGATFRIYLPVASTSARPTALAEPEPEPRGGKETILLAEDDAAVRSLTARVLEASGYTVIAAPDGLQAIEQLQRHGDRIDLLVVDVVMPGKNGREVVEQAQRINSAVKVIFTSGYPADMLQVKTILEEGLAFLPKPASPRDLLQKVRDILDR